MARLGTGEDDGRKIVGKPKNGHTAGTVAVKIAENKGNDPRTLALQAIAPVAPRLLDLDSSAAYLGVSPWTVRDLEAAGKLRRVRLPLGDGKDLRKLLFDKQDLDRLVDVSKDSENG